MVNTGLQTVVYNIVSLPRCSGRDTVRYSQENLHSEFGDDFQLVESTREAHVTPFGMEQKFIDCYCRKGFSVG